ncbi:MAG: HDOD domain-containing protein [Gammaproteobacteria bacterium]
MSDSQLPGWLDGVERLPVLPNDVHRLIKGLADESLDFKGLAKQLEAHQGIASRLLAVANSAWVGSKEPVTSIEQACFKLGLNMVRGISIGLAVMKPFNVAFCPAFDKKRYWSSSLIVAQAASLLANQLPVSEQAGHDAGALHTAGVLHNIGLLCLADIKPQETLMVLKRRMAQPEITLIQAFREAIDTDYCEVGGFLADRWGIAEILVACIQYHRAADYRGPYSHQATLVGIAADWVGLLFRQHELLPSVYLERQAIDVNRQQAIFRRLELEYRKISESAALLFL